MKLLIKLTLVAIALAVIWNYFSRNGQKEPLFSLGNKTDSLSVNIRKPEKDELKSILRKVKDLIYREATIHNPPGDMLPDNIDNNVIKEVKEKVN